jgi:hypothetical protein
MFALVTIIITIPTLKFPLLPIHYHGYSISGICATLNPISEATVMLLLTAEY